jgi:hypothetical protein
LTAQCLYPSTGARYLAGMPAKPAPNEAMVQLATRVPAALLQRVKLHVVVNDTTIMEFVIAAIREKLARRDGRKS